MIATLLIVDDEPDIVDLFKRRFRKEIKNGEFNLRFAMSGEDALVQLTDGIKPEVMLILSDINMPGMHGFELLEQAKANWPDLPVIMITAYGDDDSRQKAVSLGAENYLTKPLDFTRLKKLVSNLMHQEGSN